MTAALEYLTVLYEFNPDSRPGTSHSLTLTHQLHRASLPDERTLHIQRYEIYLCKRKRENMSQNIQNKNNSVLILENEKGGRTVYGSL